VLRYSAFRFAVAAISGPRLQATKARKTNPSGFLRVFVSSRHEPDELPALTNLARTTNTSITLQQAAEKRQPELGIQN
jgi:hypothetical protein